VASSNFNDLEKPPQVALISSAFRQRIECDAFWGAIGAYSNWRFGQPEPGVSLHREQTSISLICDLVARHDDPIPTDLWDLLVSVTRSGEAPKDQSFASGARFSKRKSETSNTDSI
jgi:hypothetical protein